MPALISSFRCPDAKHLATALVMAMLAIGLSACWPSSSELDETVARSTAAVQDEHVAQLEKALQRNLIPPGESGSWVDLGEIAEKAPFPLSPALEREYDAFWLIANEGTVRSLLLITRQTYEPKRARAIAKYSRMTMITNATGGLDSALTGDKNIMVGEPAHYGIPQLPPNRLALIVNTHTRMLVRAHVPGSQDHDHSPRYTNLNLDGQPLTNQPPPDNQPQAPSAAGTRASSVDGEP